MKRYGDPVIPFRMKTEDGDRLQQRLARSGVVSSTFIRSLIQKALNTVDTTNPAA